jgi:hypothetical protein
VERRVNRPAALTPAEDRRRRLRGRNLAVMAALFAFVVLIYAVAIVRMAGG